MQVSLERVRGYSLLATLVLLPLLVVVVVLNPSEWLYIGVCLGLLIASTTFTAAAVALAMGRTRQRAAASAGIRGSAPALSVFGLLALVANMIVIGLSGRVNAWNVLLAVLVGGLLLLLREHARRQAVRARTR